MRFVIYTGCLFDEAGVYSHVRAVIAGGGYDHRLVKISQKVSSTNR